ncbi:lipoxygenase family protein [Scytonema sp. NUACC21]
MDNMNSPQQGQTLAGAYQYNYTHIEPIAMVDRLPQGENFSDPWKQLVAKQAFKLAINTLIAYVHHQEDRGKKEIEDDVREFLRQILFQTLQEEGKSFKVRLGNALFGLVPQMHLQGTQSITKAEVEVSRKTQKVETSLQQPLQGKLSNEAEVEVSRKTQKVETSLQQPLQGIVSNEAEVEVSKRIEAILQQLLQDESSPDTKVEVLKRIDPAFQQPLQDESSPNTKVEVLKGIDTAFQQPLQGIPSKEAEVGKFVTSNLMKILGEDFLKTLIKNLYKELKELGPKGRVTSLEDYRKLFAYIALPEVANTFQDDEFFAYMRLAGPNPVMIVRITEPDVRFPVTEEQYKSVMGDSDSLQNAMKEGRVYLADYAVLDGALNGTYGCEPQVQKYSYAPLAMFAVPANDVSNRLLRPVAIQCGQSPADYPAILPSTGADAWLMAKTIVQIADTNFHEAVSHLARTHLLIEAFVIATHRQMPSTHPLFKLLVPHFQGTLAINYAAYEFLVAPKGGVNALLSSTIENSRVLVVKGFQARGFNADMLPQRLKDRGVDEPSVLPIYPYRDDGLLIWEAIHDWVEAYLGLYYNSDEDVEGDRQLQNWAEELVAFDGARLQDFGDRGDGKIETLKYLIDAVTMVIFTASAQHAAVNFPQNDIMSFAPAMPAAGYATAKAVGARTTKQNWLDLLPPLDQAQEQLNLLYLLGSTYYTKLGDYEDGYFTDSKVVESLKAFQKRLQDIEEIIDRRNLERSPYNYLKPSQIPQSINI